MSRFPHVSGDAPSDLTLVDLTWREGQIEHWIRFGRPAWEQTLDRHRRIVCFAPGAVFAFLRWASNDYGTVLSCIDILRAIPPGAPYQTLPHVSPGGEMLLRSHGWPKVEQVLQHIDAIEAQGIHPADVSAAHWRHVHSRLSVGQAPHRYSAAQHRASRMRRDILP